MEPIVIQSVQETDSDWRFVVEVGLHGGGKVGFGITVEKDYWQELTFGKFPPERLLRETLKFLIAKETTKTAVAREMGNSFHLRKVAEHYYSYERRMKMALFGTEYPKR
jgi:hypothetical protein